MLQIKLGRDFAFPEYKPNYPPTPDYKLVHVFAELKLYVSNKRLKGKAELRIKGTKKTTDVITLDAVDMELRSVLLNEQKLKFDYDGMKLTVYLPKPLKEDDEVKVTILYETKPRKGIYFILPEEYPDAKVPQVWTQGETQDNRYWLPIYDYPNMKCTSELIIYVPKGMKAVSNGVLIEHKDEGDWSIWHWKMDVPISTYLIAFAAADFDVVEEKFGDVLLQYYVPKGRKDDIPRSFSRTADIMKFFSEYTGVPYPYKKYAQACISEFTFGGMENTTITILTDRTLHDEKAHMDFESEPLVAHEMAHQWFGDLVTTKDWANIWLNESFATYFQALYTRHWKGDDEFVYELLQDLDAYLREYGERYSRPIVTRIFKLSMEVFDSHSYPKGALVLHTLKHLIGEDNFKKAVNLWLNKFKFNVADTEDLRKVFEEVYEQDLEWFFDQYVYNAGHPVLNVSYSWAEKDKLLKLTLAQKQGDDSLDVYRMPLDIVIKLGETTIKKQIFMNEKEMRLFLPLDSKPDYVCIDPEFKVFKVLNYELSPDELMKLLKSEYTYCKVLAARSLAKFRSSRVVKALKEFIETEKFWGVRVEAVKTLGVLKIDDALDALIDLEGKVKHPRVRRAVANALGNYKEEKAAKVLVKILENDNESYYVRQSAATSLGKTKWSGAFDYLKKVLNVPSHNYVITIGAIRGLSELGGDEAFKLIKEYTPKGKPTLVRAAAIVALARFPEKREAKDIIRDALFDDNFRIRVSAVLAIKELLDPTFLPLLDKLSREDLFERVQRYAREVANRIRKFIEKGTEYQKLREEIEKIKEENRKLLDTIGKLESKL
ncbi:MAG: M1 family aminopeptidase [Candidatus Asgardarchaeia archaeon]